MKNFFKIGIIILLSITLQACGTSETKKGSNNLENKESIKKAELAYNGGEYVGDYENDEFYSKIMEIESCTDPDKLTKMLKDIYGENFVYTKLENVAENRYRFPDNTDLPVFCSVHGVFKIRKDVFAKPDVYFVYKEFDDGEGKIVSEEPTFMIDKYGSYLVDKYEYLTDESTGKEMLGVEAWSVLDLYMCQKGFIDNNEMRLYLSQYVDKMDFFKEFEYLLNEYFNKDDTNNKNTEENLIENNKDSEQGYTYGEKDANYNKDSEIDELSIIRNIDGCSDPDELCDILFNIYNCEFRYDILHWDNAYKQFKSDNFGSYYTCRLHKYQRPRMITLKFNSDRAYLFYRAFYSKGEDEPRFSRYPLFIMDNHGSYIIFEDKNSFVEAFSILELYAGSNGLYNGIYPDEIQLYKDLIKGFKNTVTVTEFFDKVKEYTGASSLN